MKPQRVSEHDLEAMLRSHEPAEPPPDLAARIKAEIPAGLSGVPPVAPGPQEIPQESAVLQGPWRRHAPKLALAASLAVAMLGGWLAYRLQLGVPPVAPVAQEPANNQARTGGAGKDEAARAASKVFPPPPPAAPPAPKAVPAPAESELRRLDDFGSSVDSTAAPVQPFSVPEGVIRQRLEAELDTSSSGNVAADASEGVVGASKASAPATAVTEAEPVGGVEEGVDSGIVGSVEGGVVGGVPGGTPGGVSGGTPGGVVGGTLGTAPVAPGRQQGVAASAPQPLRVGGSPEKRVLDAKAEDRLDGDLFLYDHGANRFVETERDRLSTFALDVDTGSYTVVRKLLDGGALPPREAVRVEEMVNFFDYGDLPPRDADFAVYAEAAPAPFLTAPGVAGARAVLVRFAVKARVIPEADRKPALLVFVIDVSGSMDQGNRLGLVKQALSLLLDQLTPEDRIGIVTYSDTAEVLLEPTADHEAARAAIDRLATRASTNVEAGLTLAYDLVDRSFRPGASHRLILCSDGVANVGVTGPEGILGRIERESRRGIELTTVGFGMGNYNDALMEQLADQGDGRYAYVDRLEEARRIFVEELGGTLETVAGDAKAQVEWNPAVVSRYRLLGYENRAVADERFRDDSVDAGEIGSGHAVTALYEVRLTDGAARGARLARLTLRFHSKAERTVLEQYRDLEVGAVGASWESASKAFRLSSLVAAFAEALREGPAAGRIDLAEIFRRTQRVALDYEGRTDIAELASLVGRAARLRAVGRDER